MAETQKRKKSGNDMPMEMPGKGKAPMKADKKSTGTAEKSGQATTKREQKTVKKS